jgi:predicted metalloendopeptidase
MLAGPVALLAMAACTTAGHGGGARTEPLASGVDTRYRDDAVRPQDDPYRHLHGKWLETFEIPPDKGNYDSFAYVDDQTQAQLRDIVADLAAQLPPAEAGDARKIADLYASFMDEERLDQLDLAPLGQAFAEVDALAAKRGIAALIARFNRRGADAPFDLSVNPDQKDSTRYAVSLTQSGLGLPDRDYYLKDDAKLKEAREKYAVHVETMLRMAGDADARRSAADIVKLETALAELQWTRVANRDPEKTYNKMTIPELRALMPHLDWDSYLDGAGLEGKTDALIVRQPSYFQGLDRLIDDTPLPAWKSYFRWRRLSAAAPYLSRRFVDERFAFTGTALRGVPQNLPRWKRGLSLVDGEMGEAIGKLYVARFFPPQNKARMEALVGNLIEAYRREVDVLDWMGLKTKRGAQDKLAKLSIKIGYPNRWRDYGPLVIKPDDLWGNVERAEEFEYRRNLDKLGKPIDRDEWNMNPQTVNAYYNPVMNEIVFPAAILQPPFFDALADDAVNYGGIVAVIGHEVSHGFDDRGSQYDADGNLRDWFAPEDHARFAAKTRALVAQYAAFEPVPGYHVNGELTLGENIADNSGLALAFKAYQMSLAGKPAPVIDGMTGEQRFYYGWMQVWRAKVRPDEAIRRIKVDPHSPPWVRGTAPLVNQPGFYQAFGVHSGDRMYRPPAERVLIW